jgi:hypothetical protein
MASSRIWNRRNAVPAGIVVALVLGALAFVGSSLRRTEPPTYTPSLVRPREAGGALVGPVVYTIDATHDREWRRFDFSRGSRVEPHGPLDWDLAFRRSRIISNGGPAFVGQGGIADLGAVPFGSVAVAPARGYQPTATGQDTVNPAIADWYDYSFTSHILTSKRHDYAVRTADGRYAKLEILSYYCPGARPGCVTFRYVYQGDGSRGMGSER